MYSRYKLVITDQANRALIAMFSNAFDALTDREKENAPTVVSK